MIFIWIALAAIAIAIATAGLRKAGVGFNLSSINLGELGSILSNRWLWGTVAVALAVGGTLLLEPTKETVSLLLGGAVFATLAILAILGKGGFPAKIGLAITALALVLFGARTPELLEKMQRNASEVVLEGKSISLPNPRSEKETGRTSVPSPTTEVVVDWGQGSGKPPVGVWSLPVMGRPGFQVQFPAGCGVVYEVESHYYSRPVQWQVLPCTAKNAVFSELRFKLLREEENLKVGFYPY